MPDPADLSSYQARLTTGEVCALAGYGPGTLWRRIKAGRMPKPIDRGRQCIFDRDEVFKALGFAVAGAAARPKPEAENPWGGYAEILREHAEVGFATAKRRCTREMVKAAFEGHE